MGLFKRSTFEPHPEGLTIGTLADIGLDEEGKYGPQIKWAFDTEELMSDERPFRINYWTSLAINEKSNLYKLLKAFGENPDAEEWTDLEEMSELETFLGTKVQLNIIHKRSGDGFVAKVDTILPVKRRTAPAAAGNGKPAAAPATAAKPAPARRSAREQAFAEDD